MGSSFIHLIRTDSNEFFLMALLCFDHSLTSDTVRLILESDPTLSVCSAVSVTCDSLRPYELWPARFLCLRDPPGKNTGVGCCALLQGIFPTQGSNWVFCIAGGLFTAEPLEKLLGLTLAPVISLSISEIHSLENVLETTVWVSMLLATGEALLSGSLRRQNLEIQVYILTHIYNLAVSSQCTIFQNCFGQPFFFTQFHEIFSYICNSVKILLSWSTFHPGIHQLLG